MNEVMNSNLLMILIFEKKISNIMIYKLFLYVFRAARDLKSVSVSKNSSKLLRIIFK